MTANISIASVMMAATVVRLVAKVSFCYINFIAVLAYVLYIIVEQIIVCSLSVLICQLANFYGCSLQGSFGIFF
jgi:hypothetical protein